MALKSMMDDEANFHLKKAVVSNLEEELRKGFLQGKSGWNYMENARLGALLLAAVARKDWAAVISYAGMLLVKYMSGDKAE